MKKKTVRKTTRKPKLVTIAWECPVDLRLELKDIAESTGTDLETVASVILQLQLRSIGVLPDYETKQAMKKKKCSK